jgi:hypothetical protein
VNPTDSTNSGDSINLDIASEGEWIKALNYTAIKASISNKLNIRKSLSKMTIMILNHIYDLRQSNKFSYDLDDLNQSKRLSNQMNQSKRVFIQIKNDFAKRHKIKNRSDTINDLLTRSINKNSLTCNISTLNQHVSFKWYDAMNENCLFDRWNLSDQDDIDWNELI